MIKLDNFFISCIGCENETLVPNNSEKKNPMRVMASRLDHMSVLYVHLVKSW